MKRVQLFHWKLSEVDERLDRLAGAGFDATHVDLNDPSQRKQPNNPDAYVIDLSRLPSHGRAIALSLRQRKSSRHIPIVFVDGAAEKVESIQAMFPDAVYTDWPRIKATLNRAIALPPKDPIVPKSDSGPESGTPLSKKLGLKEGCRVLLVDAPKQFEKLLEPLPPNATISRRSQRNCDLIVWFVDSNDVLQGRIEHIVETMGNAGLWIAWPKKASGVQTDLSDNLIRQRGLAAGLVDYKVCAIDKTWSAYKFAKRKK
jgi:CheY-like chemotaxis protein